LYRPVRYIPNVRPRVKFNSGDSASSSWSFGARSGLGRGPAGPNDLAYTPYDTHMREPCSTNSTSCAQAAVKAAQWRSVSPAGPCGCAAA
jgi:hypothetical protein